MVENTMRVGRWSARMKTFLTGLLVSAILPGCTDLTEHEMAFNAGLHIISPEDFSTMGVISDMAGARSLLIYPGNFFVVSTEGTISRFDSESMGLVEVYQVGAPSPAGFSQIVFSTLKNSAYLIGAMGNIVEISMPDCTLIEEFSVCPSPVKLALGPGAQNLFVADGPSSRIHQVSISNNKAYDNVSIYFTINCMSPFQNPDSMLVGTSDGVALIEVLGPTDIRGSMLGTPIFFLDLVAVPNDTVFVGVSSSRVGIFDLYPLSLTPPESPFYGKVELEGSNHILAMGQDWQHAYVLSYLSDQGISRLVSYRYNSHTISQEVDIPGYPLDLKVSGNGYIYVLTTE